MRIKDKKIILTGAGSGIGRELAIQLLKKGALVAALDINEENLNTLKNELNNDNLKTYVVDVSNDESINSFKNNYFNDFSNADILINNAGIIQPFKRIDELDYSTIERVMNINFYGPLKLTKIFLPELLSRPEGHIVNVSSMGGFFPFPGQSVYGASKAALKLFTEGLYAELLNTNVHVTIVFPGAVNTSIVSNSNVESNNSSSSNYKMVSALDAALSIINSIEANKFQVYIGKDAKIMNLMYKFSPKKAISFINKKMSNISR
ncbi:MAG: SDR family oxidoreductase [Tenericutes bacterium]|nr:SDR family oxidoreductase [Mycoplasmatota bacterium]